MHPREEGQEEEGRARVRTLKVPRKILDEVYHVFVESSMGAVLLTTSRNEMHRFQFA